MTKKVDGVKFRPQTFSRSTLMSVAMADAGLIPAPHIIMEQTKTGLVRHRNDNRNIRPSIRVAW